MNLVTIPLRNTRRRPAKTILLLTVFTLGVMSIIALLQVSLVVGENFEKKLNAFGANIIISPQAQKLSVSYGGFHMGDMLFAVQELSYNDTIAAIQTIGHRDRISAVAPKLVTTTQLGQTVTAVVGVSWQEERGIKSYWATQGSFPETADQLLLGKKAATSLGMAAGDTLQLFGSPFTVTGILHETGTEDDSVILMDLSRLQQLLGRPDATSFVEVAALCHGCPIDDIVAQLRQALPGAEIKALQNVVNQRMASVHFVQQLALIISLVIVLTAAAMVGLSMLSAVNERRRDIGILRSLGYAKRQIFFIFCLEAGFIGVIAGLIGYLSGYGISFQVLAMLDIGEGVAASFSLTHLLLTSIIFGLVTVVAALYPAWKGSAIEPSAALVAL